MGLPNNGTYKFVNETTGLYLDLHRGSIEPNTNIIGFSEHGGISQKWVLARDGKNLITLHNLISPEAGVADRGHHPGSEVIVRPARERYELIEVDTGLYKIKVRGENLFMRLAGHVPVTPVTVDRDGLSHELWRFVV